MDKAVEARVVADPTDIRDTKRRYGAGVLTYRQMSCTADEPLAIAERMPAAQRYRFGDGAREALAQDLAHRMRQPRFASARSVHNALGLARLRAASRLFADRELVLTEADLTTLVPTDILASRVFPSAAA